MTGATGMIGRHLVPHLKAAGYQVRVLTRGGRSHGDTGTEAVTGDLLDYDSLVDATRDIGVVVHLAGAKNDEPDSEEVNVGGARRLARACHENAVPLIVNVSTQSAGLSRPGLYGATKAAAETALLNSGVPTINLRVSLVYTTLSEGAFGKLVSLSRLPVAPVFGSGGAQYWPIHVDDLSEAISRACQRPELAGRTLDVGGPTQISIDDLIRTLARRRDRRIRLVHVPVALGLSASRVRVGPLRPPLSASNVLGGAEAVPMDVEAAQAALGFEPRSLEAGMSQLFNVEPPGEAEVLLSYAGSRRRRPWPGSPEQTALYGRALETHGLTPGLDESIQRHPVLLGGLDWTTRLLRPGAQLQKKLMIAAAIVESSPTAEWLSPRRRSVPALVASFLALLPRLLFKAVLGLVVVADRPLWRRNAI